MTQEALCEAVAVMVEGIVLLANPKLSEFSHYLIDFYLTVVSEADGEPLLKSESGTVTGLDDHNPRGFIVVAPIREFMLVKLNGGVVEAEAEKLEELVRRGHMIDVEVDHFGLSLFEELLHVLVEG